jgi:hypothetical protein
VRLIADAGFDANHVLAVGDFRRFGIFRQWLAAGIKKKCARHLGCAKRDQLIRSFQIVVLQRRLVNLRDKDKLVFTVRLHRIKMLGALGKRRVKYVAPRT